MDEPTSSLTENEVEHLFRIIRDLRARGVAIIYISHKMEEILKISDEVTIMRDGRRVGTWPASELTEDLIIRNMVGRDLTHRFPERQQHPGRGDAQGEQPDLAPAPLLPQRLLRAAARARSWGSAAWSAPSGPSWWRRSSGCARSPPAASSWAASR